VLALDEQARDGQVERIARVVTMRFGAYAQREPVVVLPPLRQAPPEVGGLAEGHGAGEGA